MVTDVLKQSLADMLSTVSDPTFFSGGRTGKLVELDIYPETLKTYLSTVDPEPFMADVSELSSVLGSGGSVLAQVPLLQARPNGLFDAFLTFLEKELTNWMEEPQGKSRLATYLSEVATTQTTLGRRYRRVLTREAQVLLQSARGVASSEVQIAQEVDADLRKEILGSGEGLTSLTVNPDLLGGARMFKGGLLRDESWRARLTRVLSVIS